MSNLKKIARALVASYKGILAADESDRTIKKRLNSVGVESTLENRRAYREMLLTTPRIENYISGVILFDETIKDHLSTGENFAEYLTKRGIIPGIKVDKGAKDLAFFPGEKVTEGLDGLRERLAEYKDLGAKFTKWRAVIVIDEKSELPTGEAIDANAHALARFAALSQEAGMVPIVEPEVLMDGNHSLERCGEVSGLVWDRVFEELRKYRVDLEGMLLKTNMVISGKEASRKATKEEIAEATVEGFKAHVPEEIPGVVFLSGGQSPEEATVNLNEISQVAKRVDVPWELSYSYGRGLQGEALVEWSGRKDKVKSAQKVFLERARKVSLARMGELE